MRGRSRGDGSRSDPRNVMIANKAYTEGYDNGFEAGKLEGARRERRALRREANLFPESSRYRQWVMNWLAARSNRKPTP